MAKKVLTVLGLVLASLFIMGGSCTIKTSTETSFGLTIEDAFFAKPGPDGKPVPRDNIFKRGEKVDFVLVNVGKFKKGDGGLNWFDMDLEIQDSEGNVIGVQQSLAGEKGHVDIPNNVLPSPYGTFTAKMEPGNYKVKLIIYDKIGGNQASKSESFTVEE